MESNIAEQLENAFGTANPYEILGVSNTATPEEVKKAYRKAALKNHPDKGGDEEKFKAACVAHSILSDAEKKAIYDETGDVDDAERDSEIDEKSFDEWMKYFRNLYPKVTLDKIQKFSNSYKGGEEEAGDVLKFYTQYKGNMKNVMGSVMLADDENDEARFVTIINRAIDNKEAESYPKYEAYLVRHGKKGKSTRSKKKGEKKAKASCFSDDSVSDEESIGPDGNDTEQAEEEEVKLEGMNRKRSEAIPATKESKANLKKVKAFNGFMGEIRNERVGSKKNDVDGINERGSMDIYPEKLSKKNKVHGRKKSQPTAGVVVVSSRSASDLTRFDVDTVEDQECTGSIDAMGGMKAADSGGDGGGLEAMIRTRQTQRQGKGYDGGFGALADLANKYVKSEGKKGKGKAKGSEYEIDDAAFEAMQAKIMKK